tara:strand:+ start:636 stop:992 length:357 start_codon:yes stop_codon:yes gene_type:complete
MKNKKFENIEKLINNNRIEQAQLELSKFGSEFLKNSDYLYLRSKLFYANKLYYIALDTLLIALEFDESEKVYKLISTIYNTLENYELSKEIANQNLRSDSIRKLKSELTGISQQGYEA